MIIADPNSSLHQVREELARMTHLYAMLSHINRAIVRTDDPQDLFASLCRIAVEQGGFSLAWVDLVEPGSRRAVLVAHTGVASRPLQEQLMSSALDGSDRRSPASRAILNEQPCIVNYLLADSMLHGCHREIAAHDLQAAASFPLWLEGRVMGAFTVTATRPGYFTEQEQKLLTEVANDVSFALDVMRREEQRSAAESRMQYLAQYDSQTGLPSRVLFESRLRDRCQHSENLVVMVISLTRYHSVLQTLGQAASGEMSTAVASKLEAMLPSDFVGRVAEAQFAVIQDDVESLTQIEAMAALMHHNLSEGLTIAGQEVYLEPYVGIALYPQDGTPQNLLTRAIVAADMLPRDSGGGWRFFVSHMEQVPRKRLDLDTALRRALKRKEFVLHYQPQVDLISGKVIGAETLLRWNRPGHGMVSPLDFIPLLEENGLIWDVGKWVMNEACRANRKWQDMGLPPIRIAVNLSARQFQDGDIQSMVKRALQTSKLDPKWLELELTESIILLSADAVIRTMQNLKSEGISHALDDFGTGYSSLSYLQRLPVERIKIDRSFVSNITSSPGDAAIARAVVGMAHSLNMTVIAEGVETEGQLGYLRGLGCEELQGYYFSRPLPEEDFTHLLESGRGIAPAPRAAAPNHTLLLVADTEDALAQLVRTFESGTWTVLTASSTRLAFEMLATRKIGVVACDRHMAEMPGAEFLRRVRDLYPHAIRVMLSDMMELSTILDAVNSGLIYKFLVKPWDDEQARSCLRDAFQLYDVGCENRDLKQKLQVSVNAAA